MQTAPQPNLDRIFHALADPTRRSLLRGVAGGERTISHLATPHALTFAAISKHLKVLESAALIRRRKEGSFQMISLNPDALRSADEWLKFYQRFWTERLDALKNLLEEEDEKP